MPYNGSGIFSRVMDWTDDAAAAVKIRADRHDQNDDDLAAGLSNAICKDGQTQITQDIPFNGKKITNLAAPTNPTDAATKGYADSIRSFSSGTTLTGVSTGSSPNFISTAFIGFTEADLSIVARKADNAVTPPTVDRLMLNSTANGLGPDIGPLATQTALPRNRIVNGAMQISQENGDNPVNTGGYPADQWIGLSAIAGVAFARGRPGPASGNDYIGGSITTPKPSLATGDYYLFRQVIEGTRVKDFRYGTANAKQAVLCFSALATAVGGTYAVAIKNVGISRTFLAPFTLPVGAWTEFTIVIPGDTTGTWLTTTGGGLQVEFNFAAGASLLGAAGWQADNKHGITGMTNGAATAGQFWIADVGLYLDPDNTGIAPKWTMPDEAEELRACQRYWFQTKGLPMKGVVLAGTGPVAFSMSNPVQMRAVPALSLSGTIDIHDGSASGTMTGVSTNSCTPDYIAMNPTVGGGPFSTASRPVFISLASAGLFKVSARM